MKPILICLLLLVVSALLHQSWILYENWRFTFRGYGVDGGDFKVFGSQEFDRSGGKFLKLSREDSFVIPYYFLQPEGNECRDTKLNKNQIKTNGSTITLSFNIDICEQYDYTHVRLGGAGPNVFDPTSYKYQHNLDNDKPISPIDVDCMSYGNNGLYDITYGIRVKNVDSLDDVETGSFSCTLENLPSGTYGVHYVQNSGATSSQIIKVGEEALDENNSINEE